MVSLRRASGGVESAGGALAGESVGVAGADSGGGFPKVGTDS